jgi:sterol desaturase/sphingolipid hydroxylase (fatty acid hydroxylase superfamily)
MRIDPSIKRRIIRNAFLSLLFYALPPLLMLATLFLQGKDLWSHPSEAVHQTGVFWTFCNLLSGNGFIVFVIALGLAEFTLGRYGEEWRGNEKALDLVCFALPKLVFGPLFAWFSLKILPLVVPQAHNVFNWVPFFWGILILCVADDLTQYWYHRLHHEIPWLWRFHRTHHSAPYMGMSMASRQNAIYTVFFSQTYVTSILVYLGLGPASVAVLTIKSLITTLAHSSIPWDKPFYEQKLLHPIAWVLERTISTPATHHAHHAATTDDGIGYYKGNFGNMFFLWDVIFGTAHISRRYPKAYGISHYQGDPWYAQVFWPVFKSNIPGSELAADGPLVRTDHDRPAVPKEDVLSVPVLSAGD